MRFSIDWQMGRGSLRDAGLLAAESDDGRERKGGT